MYTEGVLYINLYEWGIQFQKQPLWFYFVVDFQQIK